ncbi:hypothetical protein YC2023_070841 [Brassica napus]
MTKRHQDWKLIKGFPLIFSIGVHVTGNSTPEPGMIFSEVGQAQLTFFAKSQLPKTTQHTCMNDVSLQSAKGGGLCKFVINYTVSSYKKILYREYCYEVIRECCNFVSTIYFLDGIIFFRQTSIYDINCNIVTECRG